MTFLGLGWGIGMWENEAKGKGRKSCDGKEERGGQGERESEDVSSGPRSPLIPRAD